MERKARDIKEMTWILSEAVYTQKVRDILTDVFDEYGLAIQVQVVKMPYAYLSADLSCKYPVNILDFSMQDKIPTAGIANGSCWLDMASMEKKKGRIEKRNLDIRYYALEEKTKKKDTVQEC